jgi:hypothetical protein
MIPAHLLAGVQPLAVHGDASGFERRRQQFALPQVFYIGHASVGIIGMVQVSQVAECSTLSASDAQQFPLTTRDLGDGDVVRWSVPGSLSLASRHPLTSALVKSCWGHVLQMKTTALPIMRSWVVASVNDLVVEGSLSDHHLGIGMLHRVFVLSSSQIQAFSTSGMRHILTHRSYVAALGISPSTVADACDVVHMPLPRLVASLMGCLADTTKPARSAGGFVAARFNISTILSILHLDAMVEPGHEFGDIIQQAVGMMFRPDVADAVAEAVAAQRIRFPSRRRCRWFRLKPDVMEMQYRRHELGHNMMVRWVMVDASPQGGWDFLISRCMELVTDRRLLEANPDRSVLKDRVALDLSTVYRKRTLPATVLGRGATQLPKKAWNFVHACRLESGEHFDLWRDGVVCILSDQGTERLLADVPLIADDKTDLFVQAMERFQQGGATTSDAEVAAAYALPNAFWMPGHMHVLFNALEDASHSP